jgi:hypothetical protein
MSVHLACILRLRVIPIGVWSEATTFVRQTNLSETVQFGPAEQFFQAYPICIEPANSRGEARSSGLVEKKNL